ncbi:MAG: metallophosphoesterase [Desulfobacterales bacterium]
MRILAVSDRVEPLLYDRFDRQQFKGVNLILSCGDLPPEYLSFLLGKLKAPLYFVRGNHDFRYDSKPVPGCIDLNASLIKFGGIRMLGLEGSRWYNGGPYQYPEREMFWRIQRLRPRIWRLGGVDIIITHAPPRHVHDAEDRCHKGFKSFRWLINKYSPRYFIHGHIHANFSDPAQRVSIVNHTRVINAFGYFLLEIENAQMVE